MAYYTNVKHIRDGSTGDALMTELGTWFETDLKRQGSAMSLSLIGWKSKQGTTAEQCLGASPQPQTSIDECCLMLFQCYHYCITVHIIHRALARQVFTNLTCGDLEE